MSVFYILKYKKDIFSFKKMKEKFDKMKYLDVFLHCDCAILLCQTMQ
jgi:hypothetical protein